MNFQELLDQYKDLKLRYERGELTSEAFQDAANGLRRRDEAGVYWTIGANSGKWYRYDGKSWVEDVPEALQKAPEPVALEVQAEAEPEMELKDLENFVDETSVSGSTTISEESTSASELESSSKIEFEELPFFGTPVSSPAAAVNSNPTAESSREFEVVKDEGGPSIVPPPPPAPSVSNTTQEARTSAVPVNPIQSTQKPKKKLSPIVIILIVLLGLLMVCCVLGGGAYLLFSKMDFSSMQELSIPDPVEDALDDSFGLDLDEVPTLLPVEDMEDQDYLDNAEDAVDGFGYCDYGIVEPFSSLLENSNLENYYDESIDEITIYSDGENYFFAPPQLFCINYEDDSTYLFLESRITLNLDEMQESPEEAADRFYNSYDFTFVDVDPDDPSLLYVDYAIPYDESFDFSQFTNDIAAFRDNLDGLKMENSFVTVP